MSKSGKVAVGVVVTVALTVVVWIFIGGGAAWKSNEAFKVSHEAVTRVALVEKDTAVLETKLDSNQAEQMRRFDKIDASVEKLSDKLDSMQ